MPPESANKSVKLTAQQAQMMKDTGLPMSAAFDKLTQDTGTTSSFFMASATDPESMIGIPTQSIPDVNDPSLVMWEIMNKRLIKADYHIREDAALDDVFSILSDILVACTFGKWKVVATDMDASAETIKKVYQRIREINLVSAFKGNGINSTDRGALHTGLIHGKYALYVYRNNKAGGNRGLTNVVNLSVDGLIRMVNPRDPSDYYFYQTLNKVADFKNPAAWDDVDNETDKEKVSSEVQRVWYIPGGERLRYAKDGDGNLVYPHIQNGDWVNELENLVYVEAPTKILNDNIVTTIMNKRYLTRMSIIAVQIGIVGLVKIIFGNDADPPPSAPDERIKDANPTEYARQKKLFDDFTANMLAMIDKVYYAMLNGKPIGYVHSVEVERDEPKMALTAEFMEQVLLIYDNIIARAAGLPLQMITSVGNAVATGRLIKSVVDNSLGDKQEAVHDVLMYILRFEFGKEMENEGIDIELQPLDKADALTAAQVHLAEAQAVLALKRAEATPETLENMMLANTEIPLQKIDMSGDPDVSESGDDD